MIVEPLSTGCLDFHIPAGRTLDEVRRELHRLGARHDRHGHGPSGHLAGRAGAEPGRTSRRCCATTRTSRDRTVDRYSYRELRQFADLIQDRLKQSPNIGKVEQLGVQEEAVYLYYSGRRFSAFGLSPGDGGRAAAGSGTSTCPAAAWNCRTRTSWSSPAASSGPSRRSARS